MSFWEELVWGKQQKGPAIPRWSQQQKWVESLRWQQVTKVGWLPLFLRQTFLKLYKHSNSERVPLSTIDRLWCRFWQHIHVKHIFGFSIFKEPSGTWWTFSNTKDRTLSWSNFYRTPKSSDKKRQNHSKNLSSLEPVCHAIDHLLRIEHISSHRHGTTTFCQIVGNPHH